MLIHARGCTAARLILGARMLEWILVLVASDPDMESYPANCLRKKTVWSVLGGNTPQESYLNGMSVIRIAEQEEVDAIHPGLDFCQNPLIMPEFAGNMVSILLVLVWLIWIEWEKNQMQKHRKKSKNSPGFSR
ncbi:MAG: hypothetical protein Ct9H300mP21_09270 [Pseudomonadota bacterium]|nr:MAG: hypothetical protein Ct9H300mP21_09270 [Pseudomonadota bacterium]